MSARVLIDYIKENPDCPIEDVLNDDELLDELKTNEDILYEYLSKHFDSLITSLTNDITELTDYKYAFKFPFIASEVLSSTHQSISSKMIEVNTQTGNIYFIDLLLILSKQQIVETPLPGYVSKILSKNLENEELLTKIKPNLASIYKTLFDSIDNDSFRSIMIMLSKANIEDNERKEIEMCVEAIDGQFELLDKQKEDKEIIRQKIANLVYIVVNIAKTYSKRNDVIKKILDTMKISLQSIKSKSDNSMSDSISSNISSPTECKCINEVMVLYSNIISIYSPIDIEKYCITSSIECVNTAAAQTNSKQMEIETEVSSINKETITEMVVYYSSMLPLLYEIALKVKHYSKKTQCIPQMAIDNKMIPVSQCYLTFIDILIFFLSLSNTKLNEIESFQSSLLTELWNDMITYPNNSFLLLKINKLIELIIEKESRMSFMKGIELLASNINSHLNKTIPQINEGSLKNKSLASLNNVYLIQIYHTIVSSCKKFDIMILKEEQLNQEDDKKLQLYPSIIQRGLLKDQVQPASDLKLTNEDEDTFNLEKNIHDTEAFIFTTKKTIEASKKITAKLKAFDGF